MKKILVLLFSVFLISCNLPAVVPVSSATLPGSSIPTSAPTNTNTPSPVFSPTLIPPTPTETPIPCDPFAADFCITDGHLIFQRPIQPPDDEWVDMSYLYGTTQGRTRDAHHGVEFQDPFGTSVHAAGDGTVVFAGPDMTTKLSPWTNFYGNVIVIRHVGDVYTLYAHLSAILVLNGQEVKAGDVIGEVGQSGGATGPHLHFEVRTGRDFTDYFSTENPELWLIPPGGKGVLSITLRTSYEWNYERPLVVTHYLDGSDAQEFVYYITSYDKDFEHNAEDAGLSALPPGRYKVAFMDTSGLMERMVVVEPGRLTEVVFEVK